MKSITTYLSFDGKCRQAMSFYQECLLAELHINAYPDASGQPSSDPAAHVMHAQLVQGGAPILMASDSPQPGALQRGSNFSVSIDCESVEETERLFQALSDGGTVRMPLMDPPGARVSGCSQISSESSGC